MDKTLESMKEFYGIDNGWMLGYFVFFMFVILGFGLLFLKLDSSSYGVGLAIGMSSVYLFKTHLPKGLKKGV